MSIVNNIISRVVSDIYKDLLNSIGNNDHISLNNLYDIESPHEKYGQIKMVVKDVYHPDYCQGRLSTFFIENDIVGMMFYMLPKPNSQKPIFGVDIMSSLYALSMICIDVDTFKPDGEIIDYLQKLKSKFLEISAQRKTPTNFKDIFSTNHIVVGVKKGSEEQAKKLLIRHNNWIHSILLSKTNENNLASKNNFEHLNKWLEAMCLNIKESKYWEKVFGEQLANKLLREILFPKIGNYSDR
ncbi:hypothetical protein [Francisella sp. 19X1-34]|uniref:hypothetical protein n=1 Tax=Francisella sp. 19X1-34 TaxID=3087177 RepID=UPI002E2EA417|nr:hypothetical protein [Francisella sp. 19X1-34]MED7788037.1 hypothetical protein [Francisella sp. 19X1-34]